MRRSRKRAQALVEMAMLTPMLLLTLVFVFDLARAAATWAAISEAVREGARNSVVIGTGTAATDASIVGNVKVFGVNMTLSTISGCIHGYSSGALTPPPSAGNTGYIYLVPGSAAAGAPNAPGGQAGLVETVNVGCNAVNAAGPGAYPLKVVIAYNFQPFTPFAQQFMPGGITMVASSAMFTEF
jgi:Flp pilus assembly protein TadG